ncbi:N5-carboxyaminoimidazole ribonucleotide synthase [Lacunisphaera limnophila]|uniref:N5-carboxyaminoimidazole ribonucleotide synthase n=1 Tax=Lacunisphaera limnophila TaxID=1838286 RepID=A0A1D8ASH1_9BACT|nr:5-(carboxyamino)imidazole ribonucleotide synthase [Lacunisphaera limnophila]AOS43802.1 N5-carboxyaminoimidazole ribonucleotide synthase [Lacunisphaera limnophila]
MILQGKTIGVLGGGQLGRMLAQAVKRLGGRIHVYEPQAQCPAGAVADKEINAAYEDIAALSAFARECDVVTYEFENVPSAPLRAIEGLTSLRPDWRVLATAQNRSREKNWLKQHGFPHARFAEVAAGGDLVAGIREVGVPCVVKTADFGYDGKGQLKVMTAADVPAAVARFAGQPVVIEQFVDFAGEVSAVVARSVNGETAVFPVAENLHANHILDFSIVPARLDPAITAAAEAMAGVVAEKIGLVGVLGVEFFVTKSGAVLINELAPRTHNSGHYTMDACVTSQFEQQARAICGLPLGSVALTSPVVMVNLLGDVWAKGEPDWAGLQARPGIHLHLYGKAEARPGRKMGHFNVLAADVDSALEQARVAKAALLG